MPTIYATTDDLASWLAPTPAPDNAAALLRSASMAVTEATETAFYAADSTTGLPTDAKTLQAFKDATCVQAAALMAFGVDPNAGGTLEAGGVESAVGLLSARVTYADAAAAVEAQQQLLGGLTLDAQRVLRQAGIQLGVPWIVG